MTPPAGPIRRPDPGTPRRAALAGWLALLLILLVAGLQQVEGWLASRAPAAQAVAPAVEPPAIEVEINGRLAAKFQNNPLFTPQTLAQFLTSMDNLAITPEDKVRTAIVAAELGSAEDALTRLDSASREVASDSLLGEDIADLRALYQGAPDSPANFDTATADRLIDHHGWFGRLAAVYQHPDSDPAREALIGGGTALVIVLLSFAGIVTIAFLAGFVLLVVGIVMSASGRLRRRFAPPAPGGSIAIEMVAVFAAGFIVLKLTAAAVAVLAGEEIGLPFVLGSQWLLALVIFWPLVRGMRAREGFALLGLHGGRGVFREIGCGIIGYLACLPLLLLGITLTVILLIIKEFIAQLFGVKPPPPVNPIAEMLSQPPWVLVMLFVLATVWAPLVEETVFRGALYRHLRGWWRPATAAIVSAVAFGLMHPYVLLAQFPVIALGIGFALMREWRGSIVSSITAHAIHNASTLSILLIVMRLLGMGS